MPYNIVEKIFLSHLFDKSNKLIPGEKIGLIIDQTLTQDATGTMAYIEFEALGINKINTKLSVSYVDHNTLQTGFENADDHIFLKTFAKKYGIIFSPAGNGICHQLHLNNFAVPGQTLLGSDSHTPTCGAIGMIAIGAGGLDIACALAGRPFYLTMPEVVKIEVKGKLSKGVSAKDIILELLRRFTVKGGINKIFEYSGDGLNNLSIEQRATITNMGTELGLTTSIFPSDNITRNFMKFHNREKQWRPIYADKNANYSDIISIELDKIEPLIACPDSPDNVKKVKEVKGVKVNQVCIGSCTNSSYYDLKLVSEMLKKYKINSSVDLIIIPGSKEVISLLDSNGELKWIINSGARILEPACGPCIGIGQVPQTNGITLRTFNRNFKGRCGSLTASVYLCSPETAIASAITGKITDPRDLVPEIKISLPKKLNFKPNFIYPAKTKKEKTEIVRGPNIKPLPVFNPCPETISSKVLIILGKNISTDDILPGGTKIMALRSNIPAISEYTFNRIDPDFINRAKGCNSGIIVADENYGQGSSREHAAIVIRYLGINVVIAKSFARIHLSNLINFGVLPLTFVNSEDYHNINIGDLIIIRNIRNKLVTSDTNILSAEISNKNIKIDLKHNLTEYEKQIIISGGLLNYIKNNKC